MKKTTVAVVIPNYQGEKYIVQCVESILASELEGVSIIIRIIDNASDDRALELLDKYLLSHGYLSDGMEGESKASVYLPVQIGGPTLEITRLEENTGFCHAVNVGIKKSVEDYVFLLNNDTTIQENCIQELVQFMNSHKRAFSCGAKMLAMSDPSVADDCGDYLNIMGYARGRGKGKKAADYTEIKRVSAACAGAAIYRRKLLGDGRIGFFDENHFAYLEDMDIGIRAGIYGYHNYFAPEAIVYHAGSAVSGSKHNSFKQRLSGRNNVYLLYKNLPTAMLVVNMPCIAIGFAVKLAFFTLKGLGGAYLGGIREGFELCKSAEGRENKIDFEWKRLHNYLALEFAMIKNLFVR